MVLVGIRRGGVPLADKIAIALLELEGLKIPVGSIDASLYRDDASNALPNPKLGPSDMPFSVQGKHVVLIDDVCSTARTARAALDALFDFGRPALVEFAVLVDRGGRELPMQPTYCVRSLNLDSEQRIDVVQGSNGIEAIISPEGSPSLPPPPR